MHKERGLLVVLSGPSGSGKGTVLSQAVQNCRNLCVSVSATTRSPRPGEVEGESYFFVSKEDFLKTAQAGGFIEHAEFCGNFYGTPKKWVEDMLLSGKDVILEIEVQGGMKIKEQYPDTVMVFVLPPSFAELKQRLTGRETEEEAVILSRLDQVKREISAAKQYDYVLVNDHIQETADAFLHILQSEKHKADRQFALLDHYTDEF